MATLKFLHSTRAGLAAVADALSATVVLITGILVVLYSQASSPDYHRLFRDVTVLAAIHFPLGILYFCRVRAGRRWLIAASMGLAGLSYLEFALRGL